MTLTCQDGRLSSTKNQGPISDSDEVTMLDNLIGVDVPLEIPEVPRNMALVGAIELTGADAIIAVEELQRSSGDDEIGLE